MVQNTFFWILIKNVHFKLKFTHFALVWKQSEILLYDIIVLYLTSVCTTTQDTQEDAIFDVLWALEPTPVRSFTILEMFWGKLIAPGLPIQY